MPPKRKIGPYSAKRQLANADKRTKVGRMLKAVQAELVEHLGGHATAPQRIIIQLLAIKYVRVAMLSEQLMETGDLPEHGDNHYVAWTNSISRDLERLGLERKASQIPTLKELIEQTAPAS